MKIESAIVKTIMTANALFATWNAFQVPEPIIYFVAYFSWSSVVLCYGIIDPHWLHVVNKGSKAKMIRDSFLYPITLWECRRFMYLLNKGNRLVDQLAREQRLPSPKEAKLLAKVYRKTIKWKNNFEEMKSCSTD